MEHFKWLIFIIIAAAVASGTLFLIDGRLPARRSPVIAILPAVQESAAAERTVRTETAESPAAADAAKTPESMPAADKPAGEAEAAE